MRDELIDFIFAHPFWALMFAWLVLRYSFRFFRQSLRSLTVMMHGYPPMWCDADGDFPKPEKTDEKATWHGKS